MVSELDFFTLVVGFCLLDKGSELLGLCKVSVGQEMDSGTVRLEMDVVSKLVWQSTEELLIRLTA